MDHITLFVLVIAIFGCQGQDIIGPSPANQSVLIGESHTLKCSKNAGVSGDIVWNEDIPGKDVIISIGSEIKSEVPKYTDNFLINTDGVNRYDLVISNIAIEDEGTYYCGLLTSAENSNSVVRTVEVRSSSLKMTQGDSDVTTVTVIEGEPSAVLCTALGSRPIVEMWWYHQKDGGTENRIMTGVTQTNTSNADGTFDTVSTLKYTVSKDYNKGQLRCETTGQQVAASKEYSATLNVQYIPVVEVEYYDSTVFCSSDANPVVKDSDYVFIVNGTENATSCSEGTCSLTYEVNKDTPVRCNATNSVGTGTATTIAKPGATEPPTQQETSTQEPIDPNGGDGVDGLDDTSGSNIGAIIGGVIGGIVIIIVIIVVVYIFVLKPKDNKTKNGGSHQMNASNGDKADKPVAAPRNSKADQSYHDDAEGKKPDDDTDVLQYADLDLTRKRQHDSSNNIIRTEEPTLYADVKTFIV